MLAEIYLVRLEMLLRAANNQNDTRFVPIAPTRVSKPDSGRKNG
jgi:hypothetical protein